MQNGNSFEVTIKIEAVSFNTVLITVQYPGATRVHKVEPIDAVSRVNTLKAEYEGRGAVVTMR